MGRFRFQALLSLFYLFSVPALAGDNISRVLNDLLVFKPTWVSKMVSSHDPSGKNGDGSGRPFASQTIDGKVYQTLLDVDGEGRVERIWMTAPLDRLRSDYQELWIKIDGQTAYRGDVLDFFEGRAQWKSPLVLNRKESAGAYLSMVPFSFSSRMEILFLGEPHYYQVTYRQGEGSSHGPDEKELMQFLTEPWFRSAENNEIDLRETLVHAENDVVVSHLTFEFEQYPSTLQIQIADQAPVAFLQFFGLSANVQSQQGWIESALFHHEPESNRYVTRLPIPLKKNQSIKVFDSSRHPVKGKFSFKTAPSSKNAPELLVKSKTIQITSPQGAISMFSSLAPLHFISLHETFSQGKRGSRLYLEGDEVIFTDSQNQAAFLGTGTEDYYNSGWYIDREFSNAFSGEPLFSVIDDSPGWNESTFEQVLYRHHILDPIVSRSGFDFKFEAGEVGDFHPLQIDVLALAFQFKHINVKPLSPLSLPTPKYSKKSAFDGDINSAERIKNVSILESETYFQIPCLGIDESNLRLIRTFDHSVRDQKAEIKINGRVLGLFSTKSTNPHRSFSQEMVVVSLNRQDCLNGMISLSLNPISKFTAIDVSAQQILVDTKVEKPVIGTRKKVFDTTSIHKKSFYVNDHTFAQDSSGKWHLYGIFHEEPFDPQFELQFSHAISDSFDQRFVLSDLSPIALQADENEKRIWAPHLVTHEQKAYLFYHAGTDDNHRAQMKVALSEDFNHWNKLPEPLFEDFCVSRDPMVLKVGSLWVMYYTRCNNLEEMKSGVAFRTSVDLIHWSEPQMALTLKDSSSMWNSGFTESPFVFERNGEFFLTVTSYPLSWDKSLVFKSKTPFHFDPYPLTEFNAHAPEWVKHGDRWGVTHCGAGQGGVWYSDVKWE